MVSISQQYPPFGSPLRTIYPGQYLFCRLSFRLRATIVFAILSLMTRARSEQHFHRDTSMPCIHQLALSSAIPIVFFDTRLTKVGWTPRRADARESVEIARLARFIRAQFPQNALQSAYLPAPERIVRKRTSEDDSGSATSLTCGRTARRSAAESIAKVNF